MDFLISLIICFIELVICYDFFENFFDLNERFLSLRKRILLTMLLSIIQCMLNGLNLAFLNIIILPIVFYIYTYLQFNTSKKNLIFYVVFVCTIFWGGDFLFALLLHIPSFIVENNSVTNLSSISHFMFALLLLKYLLCNLFKQASHKSLNRLDTKIFFYYLPIPISSIGLMFLLYYSGIDFNNNPLLNILSYLFFISMQLGNMLIFSAFKQYSDELENNYLQDIIIKQQNMTLCNYEQQIQQNDKQQKLIHDINNHLKSLAYLLSNQNYNEATNLLSQLNVSLTSSTSEQYTNRPILNYIITEKKNVSASHHISFIVNVEPGANFPTISDADIITIFGNLLDNAIEASQLCINPYIQLQIYTENQGNFTILKITNNHCNTLIKNSTTFETTKKNTLHHGIGLKSVETTIHNNNGMLELHTDNDTFSTIVIFNNSSQLK